MVKGNKVGLANQYFKTSPKAADAQVRASVKQISTGFVDTANIGMQSAVPPTSMAALGSKGRAASAGTKGDTSTTRGGITTDPGLGEGGGEK